MMIFMWVLWVQEAGGGRRLAPKAPKFFPLYFYYRFFFKIKVSGGGVEKSRGGSRGEQGGSTHMAAEGGRKKWSLGGGIRITRKMIIKYNSKKRWFSMRFQGEIHFSGPPRSLLREKTQKYYHASPGSPSFRSSLTSCSDQCFFQGLAEIALKIPGEKMVLKKCFKKYWNFAKFCFKTQNFDLKLAF